MVTDKTVLEQAILLVDQERSYLREERCAYEAFREQIRLTTADSTNATGSSETTEGLLTAYRNEVRDALDHEAIYGDTLAESLEEELSPALAQVLISKEPLTQRRKRDLLVETTKAIERREKFGAGLDNERAALNAFSEELTDVEEALAKLPPCSAQEQPLEQLLVVWEIYDSLLERCEQLLKQRQQQIREAERSVRIFGELHARNEFLYSGLETRYPVLSDIAATCERINSKRNGEQSSQTDHTSTNV